MLDLPAEFAPLRAEILEGLECVLTGAAFANGPPVAAFERAFATYCGVEHCVAVSTGTAALHVAMHSLDVGPGDEVITVPMSFIATAWPILYLGATPVFVDIDPERFTMDPARLEAAITAKTKAIVPVHLYGQCADMDPILEIARAHQLAVIEDCAQSHGAEYKGRRAGSMGAIGCFSFYPSKNLGGAGEGGAVTMNDPDLAARTRRLRDHAQVERYVHDELGYNYRVNSFQGVVLSIRLRHLEEYLAGRQRAAAQYDTRISEGDVTLPQRYSDGRHAHHLYVVRHPKRDALRAHLLALGVATGLHYPIPIHLQEPYRRFGFQEGDFPKTEAHARVCLSLPLFPVLTATQIQQVIDAVGSFPG